MSSLDDLSPLSPLSFHESALALALACSVGVTVGGPTRSATVPVRR